MTKATVATSAALAGIEPEAFAEYRDAAASILADLRLTKGGDQMRLWPHGAVLALLVLAGVALVLLSRRRRPADPQRTQEALDAVAAGRPLTRDQLIAFGVHAALNAVERRGVVAAVLPGDRYEVTFPDGSRLPALRSTRMWRYRRKVVLGDAVRVTVSPGDVCIIHQRLSAPYGPA
ncbi:hypothetical protein ACFFX1_16570 [Dactylosporangium sucinum]|uniref:Uncharacterized protein n=1 Tax=Dactylosporangium sucinum TaxID=1424081 RepID=A0A917TLF2_9ACTN|nr:hypothetical protein [Dactylosporangium sucinum]GGM26396.1 hypothetical protein GCM10007977_029530 [Dactylosporangium sucinum]